MQGAGAAAAAGSSQRAAADKPGPAAEPQRALVRNPRAGE